MYRSGHRRRGLQPQTIHFYAIQNVVAARERRDEKVEDLAGVGSAVEEIAGLNEMGFAADPTGFLVDGGDTGEGALCEGESERT